MPLTYTRAVKVTVASVLLSGLVYILGHSQVAGYMLLATGAVGMAVTVGSATGHIEIIGRDGTVIPPMTWMTGRFQSIDTDQALGERRIYQSNV